jgi:hypothetical protein
MDKRRRGYFNRLLGADRGSRAAARLGNHWQGAGVGCEDVIEGRLRSGCQAVW